MQPRDLTHRGLCVLVEGIIDILYPDGDTEADWSPDTLPEIATLIEDAGLTPRGGAK